MLTVTGGTAQKLLRTSVGKIVRLLNTGQRHERIGGSGGIAPLIFHFDEGEWLFFRSVLG